MVILRTRAFRNVSVQWRKKPSSDVRIRAALQRTPLPHDSQTRKHFSKRASHRFGRHLPLFERSWSKGLSPCFRFAIVRTLVTVSHHPARRALQTPCLVSSVLDWRLATLHTFDSKSSAQFVFCFQRGAAVTHSTKSSRSKRATTIFQLLPKSDCTPASPSWHRHQVSAMEKESRGFGNVWCATAARTCSLGGCPPSAAASHPPPLRDRAASVRSSGSWVNTSGCALSRGSIDPRVGRKHAGLPGQRVGTV